jgi:chromosome segregation ATPase
MLEKNRLNEDEIDKLIQIRDKLEEQSKTQKEFAERISESENMKDELVEELRKENEKITKEIVG